MAVYTGNSNLVVPVHQNTPVYTGNSSLIVPVHGSALPRYNGSSVLSTVSPTIQSSGRLLPVFTGRSNLSTNKASFLANILSIVDDTDSSLVSFTGDWQVGTNKWYNNTKYRYFFPGFGASNYWWQWTHKNLQPGIYNVMTTWMTNPNRATNIRYDIIIGGQTVKTSYVNQQLNAIGITQGGVVFQSIGFVYTNGSDINVRVYGNDNGYSIADATLVYAYQSFSKPIYSGLANLSKKPVFGVLTSIIPPKYVANTKLSISKGVLTTNANSLKPVYRAIGNLSKHPDLYGEANRTLPVYTGISSIVAMVDLRSSPVSTVPVFGAEAELLLGNVELNSTGLSFLPIYVGDTVLFVKKVLFTKGSNIVEGFVYNNVLYITDEIVKTNYVKDTEKQSRYV